MSNLYFYADESSIIELQRDTQKIISCGSDFGYGNFGDILQNLNSISFLKKNEMLSVVSIFTVDAIGFKDFSTWAKKSHGMDAVIYVSHQPIDFSDSGVKLKPVLEIRNMAAFHLYGGGFLNKMWGDIYIKIAEFFMGINPGMKYFISGQQISLDFVPRLVEHFKKHPPSLLGVRDDESAINLHAYGIASEFSFDDATEQLQRLSKKICIKKSSGVFIHLNISDYTANEHGFDILENQLSHLRKKTNGADATLFQAFRDPREGVLDTRESLKEMDYRSSLENYRMIELVPMVYRGENEEKNIVHGELGFSCSYHVALMLQLSGIPCWLRSSNGFYSQKAKALQVNQSFDEFLSSPYLANHSVNLERRFKWLNKFENEILNLDVVNNNINLSKNIYFDKCEKFFFKGFPKSNEVILNKDKELEKLQMQLNASLQQISLVSSSLRDELVAKVKQVELVRQAADLECETLRILHKENEENFEKILQSRSWKITRPLRSIARYMNHGYFDSKGEIGLFSALQIISKKLPIPEKIRRNLGSLLSKFRR